MEFFHSDKAPAAIGPYSQAVGTEQFVFLSGQIALKPGSGALSGTTAAEQARVCLENMREVLAAAKLSLGAVVKTTIFLVDLDDFGAVNEAYAEAMGNHKPARSTVVVAALPKGARVEIEAIARRG